MSSHNITISFDNGQPYVDLPELLVEPNDVIDWKSFDGKPFTLFFSNGAPFKASAKKLYHIEKGSFKQSIGKPNAVHTYKYYVFFHDEMLDPIIIVDPR